MIIILIRTLTTYVYSVYIYIYIHIFLYYIYSKASYIVALTISWRDSPGASRIFWGCPKHRRAQCFVTCVSFC